MSQLRFTRCFRGLLSCKLFLSIILFFNAACTTLPVSESLQTAVFNEAKQKFFNKKERDTSSNWHILNNSSLTQYISKIGEQVRKQSAAPEVYYQIIDTPVVQATSSSLGPIIYITRGMLVSMQNEAELACLLGHELHHQEQFIKSTEPRDSSSDAFRKTILREMTPDALKRIGIPEDIEDISYSNFSKERETKADEEGAVLCHLAGYDSFAMPNLLARLSNQVSDGFFERIRKIKGSHERLKVRSEHLTAFLETKGIKRHSGQIKTADFQKALYFTSQPQDALSPAQKRTLEDLNRFEIQIDKSFQSKMPLHSQQIVKILRRLSKIVQEEHFSYHDFLSSGSTKSASDDSFMEERVVNPKDLVSNYRSQVLGRIQALLVRLSQITLGFVPYVGSAIDLFEVVTGRDFFSGEVISTAGRALTAAGFIVGQGGNFRKIEQAILPGLQNANEVKRILQITETDAKIQGIERLVRHGPMNPGRLHEIKTGAGTVADTFRSGTYSLKENKQGQRLYRVQSKEYSSGDILGQYWSRNKPEGPTQSVLDSALNPTWGNKATHWIEIEVPPKTTFYEGVAEKQGGLLGGGNQVLIENVDPSWIKNQGKF